ncbi:MAG: 3-mercaptopyruvate sulfurtransferase [Rhodobacteraceae bacterium]|nr:3-mercaptopyruvate sulfurtransferase [Paracoccaceae bacterium]
MTYYPLVSTEWLTERLDDPSIAVVNAWMPPVTTPDMAPLFEDAHIPGAVFFDVNKVCDTASDLPHMLPAPHVFSSAVRKMGIGDGMTIVVYDDFGYYSSARVWWTFRTMGVENVYVLDGGMPKWKSENLPVETGAATITSPRHFHPRLDERAVANLNDVKQVLKDKSRQVLDARSAARFGGQAPEPRAGLKSGHMPGAFNLPFTELLDEQGTFKTGEALKQAFDKSGIDLSKPITTSCGSGVTAAILTLGLTILGVEDLKLYDGSWAEWGARSDVEIVTD